MNKVIDGKMYDTEKAEVIVETDNASIYKTQKGAFFLYTSRLDVDVVSNEGFIIKEDIEVLTSDGVLKKVNELAVSNQIDGDTTRKVFELLGEKIEDA